MPLFFRDPPSDFSFLSFFSRFAPLRGAFLSFFPLFPTGRGQPVGTRSDPISADLAPTGCRKVPSKTKRCCSRAIRRRHADRRDGLQRASSLPRAQHGGKLSADVGDASTACSFASDGVCRSLPRSSANPGGRQRVCARSDNLPVRDRCAVVLLCSNDHSLARDRGNRFCTNKRWWRLGRHIFCWDRPDAWS